MNGEKKLKKYRQDKAKMKMAKTLNEDFINDPGLVIAQFNNGKKKARVGDNLDFGYGKKNPNIAKKTYGKKQKGNC